jgi:hypothetical protein
MCVYLPCFIKLYDYMEQYPTKRLVKSVLC